MWIALLSLALAQGASKPPPDPVAAQESEEEKAALALRRLEVSFGSSLLFVEQAFIKQGFPNQLEERVVPVTSRLLLVEWMWTDRWSSAGMLNVPTTTVRQIDQNGDLFERHSAAAAGLGVAFTPVNVDILTDATFRPQLALMGGRTLNDQDKNVFFPLTVARLMLVSPSGTSLYGGIAYAFQEETLALIYGLGHRF